MVAFKVIPLRELYESIEWPVIVLLGSMIPIGIALESSGGTALIAEGIVGFAQGYGPVVVLAILMIVTMTLSDVMNNTATAVIAGVLCMQPPPKACRKSARIRFLLARRGTPWNAYERFPTTTPPSPTGRS